MVQRGLIHGGVAVDSESKLELLESDARRPHRWKRSELRLREIETFTQQAAQPSIGVDWAAPRNVKKLASVLHLLAHEPMLSKSRGRGFAATD